MIFSFLMYIINWIIFAFNRNLDSFINASMLTFGTGLLFFFFGYQFAQYHHAVKLKKNLEELHVKQEKKESALTFQIFPNSSFTCKSNSLKSSKYPTERLRSSASSLLA